MKKGEEKKLVLALTGASGMPYATRLLNFLTQDKRIAVHLIISRNGEKVLSQEGKNKIQPLIPQCKALYYEEQIEAAPASGSWIHHGMIICPCSMSTLAAISNGCSGNLIHRAAEVCLKEKRKLILVPRETPLSRIHLENLLKAESAGATILPASPEFYSQPQKIQDLINQIAGRILDQLGLEHNLLKRWSNL